MTEIAKLTESIRKNNKFNLYSGIIEKLKFIDDESKAMDILHKLEKKELLELIRIAYKEGQSEFKQPNQEYYDFEHSEIYKQVTKYFK